jgi:hypothetical protein
MALLSLETPNSKCIAISEVFLVVLELIAHQMPDIVFETYLSQMLIKFTISDAKGS